MPDDELTHAARLVDDRLRVAHLGLDLDRPPQLVAGALVEGDDQRVRLAADHRQEAVAVDQRGADDAPHRDARAVLRHVVLPPQHRAGLDVEAEQPPGGADDVDAVAVDGRGRPGTDRVAHRQHAVGRRPLVGPQHVAGLLVEGEHPLDAVEGARLRIFPPIGDEHPAVGDGGTRVPRANRRAPGDLQLVRQILDDARLVPDPEPVRAPPLRPVLGGRRRGHRHDGQDGSTEALRHRRCRARWLLHRRAHIASSCRCARPDRGGFRAKGDKVTPDADDGVE